MAQRIATSSGAIILREIDGTLKIALAHRSRALNLWVLPKGHVEAGESLEQAALREIYEETGLASVQLLKHLGTIARESTKSDGYTELKTIHFYLAYALNTGSSHAPTDERFIEVGWFAPEEALQLLPYESDRAFVREHLSLLFS